MADKGLLKRISLSSKSRGSFPSGSAPTGSSAVPGTAGVGPGCSKLPPVKPSPVASIPSPGSPDHSVLFPHIKTSDNLKVLPKYTAGKCASRVQSSFES